MNPSLLRHRIPRLALSATLATIAAPRLSADPFIVLDPNDSALVRSIVCMEIPEFPDQLWHVRFFNGESFNFNYGSDEPPTGTLFGPPHFYLDRDGAQAAAAAIGAVLFPTDYTKVGICCAADYPVDFAVPTQATDQGTPSTDPHDYVELHAGRLPIDFLYTAHYVPRNQPDIAYGWVDIDPMTYQQPHFFPAPPFNTNACLETALGTPVSFTPPTPVFSCEPPVVTVVRDDTLGLAAPYPVGTTLITWTATDGLGSGTYVHRVNVTASTVRAKKFYDANGNGLDDDGIVVAGWPITLSGADGAGNAVQFMQSTANDGYATFAAVPLGNYTVTEAQPGNGWVATTPTSVKVAVSGCAVAQEVVFGNHLPEDSVSIAKTRATPDPAVPGELVTWTVIVHSGGPLQSDNVTTSDTVPAAVSGITLGGPDAGSCGVAGQLVSCSFGTLPDNAVRSFTISGTLAASFTGDLANTATVVTTSPDVDPGDNVSTSTTPTSRRADLSVTKTDGAATAAPGDPITYTIVVANAGPSDVPSAMVTDLLPAAILSPTWSCVPSGGASCTAGPVAGDIADDAALPAGSSITYTVQGTIDDTFHGTLVNTADVATAAATDPAPTNDSATDSTQVSSQSVLEIPTLGGWGLALLTLFIALAGRFALRRDEHRARPDGAQ